MRQASLAAEQEAEAKARLVEATHLNVESSAITHAVTVEQDHQSVAESEPGAAEQVDAERVESERGEAERLEAERLAAERLETETLAAEKREADKLAAQQDAKRLETARQGAAAISLQAHVRGLRCRGDLRQQRNAAAAIAATARAHRAFAIRQHQLHAVVVLQAQMRGHTARAAVHNERCRINELSAFESGAAVIIQSRARGLRDRNHAHVLIEQQSQRRHNSAAVVAQAASRKLLARRRTIALRDERRRRDSAACAMQSAARMLLARKRFSRLRHSCVRVQAVARGHSGRLLAKAELRIVRAKAARIAAERESTERESQARAQQLAAMAAARAAAKLEVVSAVPTVEVEPRLRCDLRTELSSLKSALLSRAARVDSNGGSQGIDEPIGPPASIGLAKVPSDFKQRTRVKSLVLTVTMKRKEGRFGMGHDEHNIVVVVHPGSAAEECGLRVGDSIKAVDGEPLSGLLTASLQGRESVRLSLLRKATEAFEHIDLKAVAAEVRRQFDVLSPGSPSSVKAGILAQAFR